MPVVFRHRGYRLLFYSNEGDPREPPHIHVLKGQADAKFWLVPEVKLAYNRGHPRPALREAAELIAARRHFLLDAWNEFFSESGEGPVR